MRIRMREDNNRYIYRYQDSRRVCCYIPTRGVFVCKVVCWISRCWLGKFAPSEILKLGRSFTTLRQQSKQTLIKHKNHAARSHIHNILCVYVNVTIAMSVPGKMYKPLYFFTIIAISSRCFNFLFHSFRVYSEKIYIRHNFRHGCQWIEILA